LPFKRTKKRQKTPHKNHHYVLKIFIPRTGIPYQNCQPCDYNLTSEERTAAMIYNQNAVTLPQNGMFLNRRGPSTASGG
jgi:hypothetical protein